jgi:hypothetical protein
MLIRKRAAFITINRLTLLPSNSNAAAIGFRVLSVIEKTPTIRRKSGKLKNLRQKRFYAETAVSKSALPNICDLIQLARNAAVYLIRAVPIITIYILNAQSKNKLNFSQNQRRIF